MHQIKQAARNDKGEKNRRQILTNLMTPLNSRTKVPQDTVSITREKEINL
jgi:hypothetical protein